MKSLARCAAVVTTVFFFAALALCQELPAKSGVDNETFAAALKPFHKLANATDIGVSFIEYRRLLVDAKTDFDIAFSRLPDGAIKTHLGEAMRDFLLASEAWQFAIDNSLWCANRYQEGGMPTKNDFYRHLRTRYGEKLLPPPKSQQCNVKYSALLRVMWDFAGFRIQKAAQLQTEGK